MDRRDALLYMAREAPYFVLATRGEEYVREWGKTLDSAGVGVHWSHELDPRTTRVPDSKRGLDVRVVWMPTLSSHLALSLGLFTSLDHAEQTPYRRALQTAKYVGERAVLRLAMMEGKEVVTFLRERHQFDRLALAELRHFRP